MRRSTGTGSVGLVKKLAWSKRTMRECLLSKLLLICLLPFIDKKLNKVVNSRGDAVKKLAYFKGTKDTS